VEESVVFCCPHCLQHTAVTVSLERGRQRFVEDCQVCCEPIELDIDVRNGEIDRMDYRPAN
jgi:transcription elongation factor Elf1